MAVPEPGATSASGDDSNLTFGDSNGRASAGAHKQSFNLDNAIEMICRNGGLRDLEFLVAAASSGSVGSCRRKAAIQGCIFIFFIFFGDCFTLSI